jgi:hypothetical protein
MEQMEMETAVEVDTEATLAAERQAREQAQPAHVNHRQGTVGGCVLCEDVAYEPGWYALLASFARNQQDPTITLPDAPMLSI